MRADSVVVLDFETTGLSPARGDRAIEIGAIKLHQGRVVERFQELMNPGFRISRFIAEYTGISPQMLSQARSCESVMGDFYDFLGDANIVAHNMSFDRRFLEAELAHLGLRSSENYACSLLLARRTLQAPSYKLSALVASQQIPSDGVFHRALADAEVTHLLWLKSLEQLRLHHQVAEPSFALIQALSKVSKAKVPDYLRKWR